MKPVLRRRLSSSAWASSAARELNVSSDIDLVFVYPEDGETDGPRRISNREFFDRLGQRVIAAISHVDADGYVFRVDMRLRPYGESGPLTVSFAALEHYLVTQGRAWERYAWLKARPLTGERHDELAALVTPFVYRKYLDYDAYDGLRGIHRQIREQEKRRDYAQDIKLGAGGIREIEFIVQALQIVRGGREPALRIAGTLPALAARSPTRGVIAPHAASVLRDGYVFLRNARAPAAVPRRPPDAHRSRRRERARVARGSDGLRQRRSIRRSLARASRHDLAAVQCRVRRARRRRARRADADAALPLRCGTIRRPAPTLRRSRRRGLRRSGGARRKRSRGCARSRRYLQLPALSRDRFDRLVPRLLAVAADASQPAGRSPTRCSSDCSACSRPSAGAAPISRC